MVADTYMLLPHTILYSLTFLFTLKKTSI